MINIINTKYIDIHSSPVFNSNLKDCHPASPDDRGHSIVLYCENPNKVGNMRE